MKKNRNKILLSLISFLCFFSFIISTKFFDLSDNEIRNLLIKDNSIKQAFFPSTHDIRKILTYLIKNEKKSIKVAIFLITDKHIANALVNAKKENNIKIEIITCYSNLNNNFSKINLISQNDIDTYVFAPTKNIKSLAIMHNKFFIFEQNIDNKSILWTGSLNCTAKANDKNKENIIVLDDNYLINLYNKEFEDIKTKSKLIKIRKSKKKHKKRF